VSVKDKLSTSYAQKRRKEPGNGRRVELMPKGPLYRGPRSNVAIIKKWSSGRFIEDRGWRREWGSPANPRD